MDTDKDVKDIKDMAFQEELEFQLKLRPNADRRMLEAQIREKIYGPRKFGHGGKVRGAGKASKGVRPCKMR